MLKLKWLQVSPKKQAVAIAYSEQKAAAKKKTTSKGKKK